MAQFTNRWHVIAFACCTTSPLLAQEGGFASGRLGEPQIVRVAATVEEPTKTAPILSLQEISRTALSNHPRVAKAMQAIDASKGKTLQAGLYPNPTLNVSGDELGDRTGPPGIWTLKVDQEIVTAGKLGLSRAVAAREIDQATLAVLAEQYSVLASVRAAYCEASGLKQREEILVGLTDIAGQSLLNGKKLLDAGQLARLDYIQLELERERIEAELDAVRREIPTAFRRLAAIAGVAQLPIQPLEAIVLPNLPTYDLEAIKDVVTHQHPDVKAAKIGIQKSQLALQRATIEPIPNVTVSSGYTRQSQNRSNDWLVGVSVPLPTWNRNQGNVLTAQADVNSSIQEVSRVENALIDQIANSHRVYTAAVARAERYRTQIIPRAEETLKLSRDAFKGGQFEYLRVLQAQRALTESKLEWNKSLTEAWKAAAEMSGPLLEEEWPAKK